MENRWKSFNIIGLLIVLIVNGMASALPINGRNTGEISNLYPVLFTPAGYVFSIWGVIYLFLIGFVIYQALPGQASNPLLGRIGSLFVFTCVFNSAWIFAWHYDWINLSVVIMLALLVTLILIYLRLESSGKSAKPGDKWLIKVPFSVYLAWICVATIANISIALYKAGWNGWQLGSVTWTIIMIVIAALLAFYYIVHKKDIAFGLVFPWALLGIGIRQSGYFLIQWTAWVAALVLLGFIVRVVLQKNTSARTSF
jgi:translocator protein